MRKGMGGSKTSVLSDHRLTRRLAVANSSTAREQPRVRTAVKGPRTASHAALWLPVASARQTDEQ